MAQLVGQPAPLVPELDVHDLDASLRFYVGVIGFVVIFDRPRERFAYLGLDGAELMLQDASGPRRRFRTAPLERPFGRGINLQIASPNVDETLAAVRAAGIEAVIDIEERWYEVDVVTPAGRWSERGAVRAGNRQFVVADPDGYLLRFYTSLGSPPMAEGQVPNGTPAT
jgi:catechol 2,3-dioxygenase-like lactoylglutathione lyase family enzyme